MKKITTFFIASISWITLTSADDDFCGITNTTFQDGENITFKIFYNALGLYIDAGTASFTVSQEMLNNTPVYHIVGLGTSNSSYDWIFKVRDRYETFIDTASFKPLKFI